MITEETLNEVLVALADALAEITAECPPNAAFEELVRRVKSGTGFPNIHEMYLADASGQFAGAARRMQSVAARVLREHPEAIAQARMLLHYRRSTP